MSSTVTSQTARTLFTACFARISAPPGTASETGLAASPLVWGETTHRTYWNDAVPDWFPVGSGYWHTACGVSLDFHQFTADPYRRPLLAICPACGQVWKRTEARRPWRAEPMAAAAPALRIAV